MPVLVEQWSSTDIRWSRSRIPGQACRRYSMRPDDGARQAHGHLSRWTKFGTFAVIRWGSLLSGQLVSAAQLVRCSSLRSAKNKGKLPFQAESPGSVPVARSKKLAWHQYLGSGSARGGSQDFAVTRSREGGDRTDDCDACAGHHRQVIASHIGRCRSCALGSSGQQYGLAAGPQTRGGEGSQNTN